MFTLGSRAQILVALFGSAISIAAIWYGIRSKALRVYLQRPCDSQVWEERSPHAPEENLRTFLRVVLGSFSIAAEHDLKFRPDDSITAIYRATNPQPAFPDDLGLESLTISLRQHYQLDLVQLWQPHLSLGDLYALVQASNA